MRGPRILAKDNARWALLTLVRIAAAPADVVAAPEHFRAEICRLVASVTSTDFESSHRRGRSHA